VTDGNGNFLMWPAQPTVLQRYDVGVRGLTSWRELLGQASDQEITEKMAGGEGNGISYSIWLLSLA
jgi:hypothetical protein